MCGIFGVRWSWLHGGRCDRAAGEPAGERDIAAAVAAHCGLPFRPVDGGPEVLAALPALTAAWGMPLGDSSVLAAGIEGRCPYLDPGFTAAALPPTAVLGKPPLRQAFAARLPVAVLRQKKRGFSLPLDRWFRGELPWLDLLRDQRTRSHPHLRAAGLDDAIDRHRRGAADLGHALYLVVAFELHLRAASAEVPCT